MPVSTIRSMHDSLPPRLRRALLIWASAGTLICASTGWSGVTLGVGSSALFWVALIGLHLLPSWIASRQHHERTKSPRRRRRARIQAVAMRRRHWVGAAEVLRSAS